eukprot:76282-Chlamydomonas_euryale.AAC.5
MAMTFHSGLREAHLAQHWPETAQRWRKEPPSLGGKGTVSKQTLFSSRGSPCMALATSLGWRNPLPQA